MRPKKALRNVYFRLEPWLFAPLNPLLRSNVMRLGRSVAAQEYLSGSGLELGAFASPTLVPLGASVRYVDRVPANHWQTMPEYRGYKIIDPDIIDDGETLATIADSSADFLMCFQMFEHTANPLGALSSWLRVVRSSGILIISVPDKRFTRDAPRQITPWEHFRADFDAGPNRNDREHYIETGRLIENLSGDALDHYVAAAPPAIHFHVWDLPSYMGFWLKAAEHIGGFDILQVRDNRGEALAVLRRR